MTVSGIYTPSENDVTASEPGSSLIRSANVVEVKVGDESIFIHVTPKCEHEFAGWREFEDGNGGEQVCAKCGMGAMSASLRDGP